MQPIGGIDVLELFPAERAALLDLLTSLDDDEWIQPTTCGGWSVKDVAAHILSDDLGRVSRERDGFTDSWIDAPSWEALVDAINGQNERWVEAMRRLSPQVLVQLLRVSGEELHSHLRSLDLDAVGAPVSWAGPDPAPVWLDVAREYTEMWAHQQQIRDAVGRPGLKDARMFRPVLDCFARALPHTFRDVLAPQGAHVRLRITGDAGGTWSLVRVGGHWGLYEDVEVEPAAIATLDQEEAWRLFTKGTTPEAARALTVFTGDEALARRVLEAVAIIA